MTLRGSLSATRTDDGVRFDLTVENDGDEAVDLTFPDACLLDVAVEADGDRVWQFSDGQMFAQMLQSETIAAGGSWSESVTWDDPEPGAYEARGWLCANGVDCEATTTLSI